MASYNQEFCSRLTAGGFAFSFGQHESFGRSLTVRVRNTVLVFASSNGLVRASLAICSESSSAPINAGWYGRTCLTLTPFCLMNWMISTAASYSPLLETTSLGILWHVNKVCSTSMVFKVVMALIGITIWNMHQWQSENSACPSKRNKCVHAPTASQAISSEVKVLYAATCPQKHKYDKHWLFLQSHHPFQTIIIILLLETSFNTYHDALDIDHSIDIPNTCQE